MWEVNSATFNYRSYQVFSLPFVFLRRERNIHLQTDWSAASPCCCSDKFSSVQCQSAPANREIIWLAEFLCRNQTPLDRSEELTPALICAPNISILCIKATYPYLCHKEPVKGAFCIPVRPVRAKPYIPRPMRVDQAVRNISHLFLSVSTSCQNLFYQVWHC